MNVKNIVKYFGKWCCQSSPAHTKINYLKQSTCILLSSSARFWKFSLMASTSLVTRCSTVVWSSWYQVRLLWSKKYFCSYFSSATDWQVRIHIEELTTPKFKTITLAYVRCTSTVWEFYFSNVVAKLFYITFQSLHLFICIHSFTCIHSLWLNQNQLLHLLMYQMCGSIS